MNCSAIGPNVDGIAGSIQTRKIWGAGVGVGEGIGVGVGTDACVAAGLDAGTVVGVGEGCGVDAGALVGDGTFFFEVLHDASSEAARDAVPSTRFRRVIIF